MQFESSFIKNFDDVLITPLQTTHCLFCQSHNQHIYFAWNPILSEANLVDTAPSDV